MQSCVQTSLNIRKDETAQNRSCLSTESFCFSRTLSRGWGSDMLVPIPSWEDNNNFLVTQFTPSVLNKKQFPPRDLLLVFFSFLPQPSNGLFLSLFLFYVMFFLDIINATTTRWWTNKGDLQRKPIFYKVFQLLLTVTNRNWREDGISLKWLLLRFFDHTANIRTMIMMKRVSAFHRASTRLTKL